MRKCALIVRTESLFKHCVLADCNAMFFSMTALIGFPIIDRFVFNIFFR